MAKKSTATISTRVSPGAMKKINRVKSRSKYIQEVVIEMGAHCPYCEQLWPRHRQNLKPNVSARLDEDFHKILSGFTNVSKMVSVAINLDCGICPVCEQEIKE